MKFIAISDTHGEHQTVQLPPGDVIIHAGDISRRGNKSEVLEFLEWFGALDYRYKIFIAGNHDFFLEGVSQQELRELIPPGVIYLCDSGTTIDGINIWGSPVTPWFFDWAFNRHRGSDIQQHWDLIPEDTDILVTHGPVAGKLDRAISGQHVGCEDLLDKIELIKPGYHICGHIHEHYGQLTNGSTTFINASVLNEKYLHKNPPIVFDLEKKQKSLPATNTKRRAT